MREYGKKLDDLNETQQRLLTAYFLLCDGPDSMKGEGLPLEYAPALNELARISGKFVACPKASSNYKVRGNKGRQIRHSKAVGALATSLGGK